MITIPSLRPETRYGIPSADHILINRKYIIGYSYLLRQPKWSLELIDIINNVINITDRSDAFREDMRIPEKFRTTLDDYRGSGYDRGHLVSSADRRETQLLNSETFLLTNMSPQHPKLNRGIWRDLEMKTRELCGRQNVVEVYVISGPLFIIGEKIEVIGHNKNKKDDVVIPVPHAYFKTILSEETKGRVRNWTFAFPNKECKEPMSYYQRTTNDVEKWAGLSLWDRLSGMTIERMKNRIEKLWYSE